MSGSDAHPELPVDPDPGQPASSRRDRPQHVQPEYLLLVAIGGFLGALARYGFTLLVPTEDGRWPTGTFVVNMAGAFLLGALLEGLARRGADAGWRRRARLSIGTGFCGALTTWSTLAVETDLLVRSHSRGLAGAYLLASAIGGLVASAAGIAAAVGHHRWRGPRRAAS